MPVYWKPLPAAGLLPVPPAAGAALLLPASVPVCMWIRCVEKQKAGTMIVSGPYLGQLELDGSKLQQLRHACSLKYRDGWRVTHCLINVETLASATDWLLHARQLIVATALLLAPIFARGPCVSHRARQLHTDHTYTALTSTARALASRAAARLIVHPVRACTASTSISPTHQTLTLRRFPALRRCQMVL